VQIACTLPARVTHGTIAPMSRTLTFTTRAVQGAGQFAGPLAAAIAAAILFLLLRWNPTSNVTLAFAVFVIVFALVWIYRPAAFHRRMALLFSSRRSQAASHWCPPSSSIFTSRMSWGSR